MFYKVLCFLTLTVMLSACSSGSPPDSVLDSPVLARDGVDDFGGLKVSKIIEIIELMEDSGHNNVEVVGWEKNDNGYTYIYTYEIGGIESTVRTNFFPRNGYTIFQDEGNPTIMGSIQSIRAYIGVYQALNEN